MKTEAKLRVSIIDDEPLGRTLVRELLRDDAAVEIVGEAANGHEAAALIRAQMPDLVFLDVQMPEVDGFELLAALQSSSAALPPLVIFVTAYDQYAVRAFEVDAIDYLLKPLDRERFSRAVERAKEEWRRRRDAHVNERILALLEAQQPRAAARYLERLVVKTSGRVLFLKVEEIDWVEAEGNYVRLHVGKDSWWLRETMSGLEAQLEPGKFARIHRSHLVNLDRIAELRPWSHGEYQVVLRDGTELMLSRTYRERLNELLGRAL